MQKNIARFIIVILSILLATTVVSAQESDNLGQIFTPKTDTSAGIHHWTLKNNPANVDTYLLRQSYQPEDSMIIMSRVETYYLSKGPLGEFLGTIEDQAFVFELGYINVTDEVEIIAEYTIFLDADCWVRGAYNDLVFVDLTNDGCIGIDLVASRAEE